METARIIWVSLITGNQGNGSWIPLDIAEYLCEQANSEYQGVLFHWVYRKDGIPTEVPNHLKNKKHN